MGEQSYSADGVFENPNLVTLFLCGDVMTGRGIDQVLAHPSDPRIHEPYLQSAEGYVRLAERAHGPIPRPAGYDYIWGDALAAFERLRPDARIVNLETAVTTSDDHWPGKSIHYRMHPRNIPCITAAGIDSCVLANNHVLDWGYAGLAETLATLKDAGLQTAGAGLDDEAAEAPAELTVGRKGRVLVFACGHESSGIAPDWAAGARQPGVWRLADLSARSVARIRERVLAVKRPTDIAVLSIHWGGNWGYRVPEAQRRLAHWLIDQALIDVVHGHSSHHVKGIEVYRGKPILYGCGDFINDYEGIGGYEDYRGDLSLMYFATLDPAVGRLVALRMLPMQMRRFRLGRASADDARWLAALLNREGADLGARVELDADETLRLRWE